MFTDVIDYVPVGCYKDIRLNRALPTLLANYRVKNAKWPDILDWTDLENSVIKKCATKVCLIIIVDIVVVVDVFHNSCKEKKMAKVLAQTSLLIRHGTYGRLGNFIFFLRIKLCKKPVTLKWRFSKFYTRNMTSIFCPIQAKERGYSFFGIQFYGECWSGSASQSTYAKHGLSKRCTTAAPYVGKDHANFVYMLTEG